MSYFEPSNFRRCCVWWPQQPWIPSSDAIAATRAASSFKRTGIGSASPASRCSCGNTQTRHRALPQSRGCAHSITIATRSAIMQQWTSSRQPAPIRLVHFSLGPMQPFWLGSVGSRTLLRTPRQPFTQCTASLGCQLRLCALVQPSPARRGRGGCHGWQAGWWWWGPHAASHNRSFHSCPCTPSDNQWRSHGA